MFRQTSALARLSGRLPVVVTGKSVGSTSSSPPLRRRTDTHLDPREGHARLGSLSKPDPAISQSSSSSSQDRPKSTATDASRRVDRPGESSPDSASLPASLFKNDQPPRQTPELERYRSSSSLVPFSRQPAPHRPADSVSAPAPAKTESAPPSTPESRSPFANGVSLTPPVLLHNAKFKFASVTVSVERFLSDSEVVFSEDRLARLPTDAQDDVAIILSTFRRAAALPEQERSAFLAAQDVAQEMARAVGDQVAWTTEDLAAALSDLNTFPAKLANVDRLSAPDAMESRAARDRLFQMTRTADEAVEVASWIIRVTENEPNASDLLYEAILGTTHHLPILSPRPPPDVYLAMFAAHAARILKTFRRNPHPLVVLLEVYTQLYAQDQRRLDPVAQSPYAEALAEIDRLRVEHLETTRKIHQAIKEVGGRIFTQRSTGSLMDAYKYGKSFSDVQAVWEAARSDGGTGVNQQGAAIYFDACGFNGALSEALVAWKDLKAEGFPLNENNYAAYHECLDRCGAWTDLVAAFQDQHAQHTADPTSTPDVTSSALALAIKLANRLVRNPRHRSLHPVDLVAFEKLRAELRAIVSEDVWAETERLLVSRERFPSASKELMTTLKLQR